MKERDPTARYSLFVIAGYVAVVVFIFAGWHWLRNGDSGSGHALSPIFNNLRILEGAKEQWALEHHATNGALPAAAELTPYLKGGEFPAPAAGEIYTINPVGQLITAKLPMKISEFEAGTLLTVTNF
jgi:hypothetical protein